MTYDLTGYSVQTGHDVRRKKKMGKSQVFFSFIVRPQIGHLCIWIDCKAIRSTDYHYPIKVVDDG